MKSGHRHHQVRARVLGLAAHFTSVRSGADLALEQLRDVPDPEGLSRKLQVLLDADRFGDAAALVRDRPPEPEWADRAVAALVANGERGKAEAVVSWARTAAPATKWHRCVLRYAERAYGAAVDGAGKRAVRTDLLTEAQRAALTDLLRVAEPLLALLLAQRRIDNGLQERVALLAAHAFALLGERARSADVARLLSDRTPLPLEVAHLWLDGVGTPPGALAARLRTEHPRSFRAKLLACVVEARLSGRGTEAFETALALAGDACDSSERRELCGVLADIAQNLGPEQMKQVEGIAPALLREGDQFLKMLEVMGLLREGRLKDAGDRLAETRDEADPYWLQVHATYLAAMGDRSGAVDDLVRAAQIFSHPTLLHRLAVLAFEQDRLPEAKQALERLLLVEGGPADVRRNLAIVHTRLAEWKGAADQFAALRQLEPADPWHGLNQANALAHAGDLERSLAVYDDLCSGKAPPLRVLLGRAHLLRQTKGGPAAFQSLAPFRAAHWEDTQFVGAYLDLGYAADREDEAHDALLQLHHLRRSGKAGPEVLVEQSADDVIQLLRHHNEREEFLSRQLVSGKISWLMADMLLGVPSYWAWWMRTQPMDWIIDEPVVRARRCIYATNRFEPRPNEEGQQTLLPIRCPAAGAAIVVELTSMITLHRLGLLTAAAGYFGRILYPSSYDTLRLRETGRLVPHQPSRRRAVASIKRAVETKAIKVKGAIASPSDGPMPRVDEYRTGTDAGHCYRLVDLLSVLDERGYGSEAERARLKRIAREPSGVGDGHPRLAFASPVLIDQATLESLSQAGALELVLRGFDVHIAQDGLDSALATLRGFEVQDEVRTWHNELWTTVKGTSAFVPAIFRIPDDVDDPRAAEAADGGEDEDADGDGSFVHESLGAAFLAEQERLPLLADDRVVQAHMRSRRRDAEFATFGTEALVTALAEGGVISWSVAADAFLQLIAFRYRFLLPPLAVLKTLADRNMSGLPGDELRRVSAYVHDSMRDAGMFAGFEATDPPVQMAARHYQAWTYVIAEFVAEVWMDERYADANARALTRWAMRECLPSPPRNMGSNARLLCEMTPRSALTHAIIHLWPHRKYARATGCVTAIAEDLSLSDADLLKLGLEVVDGI